MLVEYLGAGLLAVAAFLALVQLAAWAWARNVAVNAAHEGARLAAEAGRPLEDGEVQTRLLLRDALGQAGMRFAVGVTQDGEVVHVVARGAAPVIVPFLPRMTVDAQASAFDEDAVFE